MRDPLILLLVIFAIVGADHWGDVTQCWDGTNYQTCKE